MENKSNIQLTRSILTIFWLGFFMAISFMEAPLKFTAPHLSMAEGLQIGKLVFGMLNVCEWGFLAVIAITCLIQKPQKAEGRLIVVAALIMTLETFWLLPALGKDADKIINGQIVTGHSLHWGYVAFELIKVPVLLLTGITGMRSLLNQRRLAI
ncbi:hypothetical protein [Mucilaginibacter sp. L3T2-6]|uniref:hypothetical protein n=1 Tax=Mucilaginibacter sp. L3T2-6 TaxID=3062491 RepID=UPI002675A320|nr:hypothetical protein [Mucilaginibacter sp. L3T2-6]MDO3641383.1 hypothetical protein [Mucilaginibacter sp. L3T2-6]MDV6213856.1 hypothetical protein [Mucilaginibacter sp. L3T2-6]